MSEFNKPTKSVIETKIDFHLDNVLRASGSSLKNYTMEKTLEGMREAMHVAMCDLSEEFIVAVLMKLEMQAAMEESELWARMRGQFQ